MRKPVICICENKDADQLCRTAQLISAFVFTTQIVQSLYLLNPKFQASSYLLWLYSRVCVRPCRKPRRPVFSKRGSYHFFRWNFKDIFHSFMMVFRVLCGEWIEPLWDCMRAADELCMAVFLPTLILGNFIVSIIIIITILKPFFPLSRVGLV